MNSLTPIAGHYFTCAADDSVNGPYDTPQAALDQVRKWIAEDDLDPAGFVFFTISRVYALDGSREAMLRAMSSFSMDHLCGDVAPETIAAEWVECGFTPASAGLWWLARCFEPSRAAELRDEGVTAYDVSPICALGDTIGYHHSNYDLSLDEVRELIK